MVTVPVADPPLSGWTCGASGTLAVLSVALTAPPLVPERYWVWLPLRFRITLADDGAPLKVRKIEILRGAASESNPEQRVQGAVLIDRKVLPLAGLPILRSELEDDRHHCSQKRIGHFLIFLPGALADFLENRPAECVHPIIPTSTVTPGGGTGARD